MGRFKDINYSLANDNFYYDETSPSFLRWKVSRGNKKAGDIAGTINNNGYYRVRYNNSDYYCHRIIWVLFHREIDSNLLIDHKDRNRLNNQKDNLILGDDSLNNYNKADYKQANHLPKNIYYHGNNKVDSNGRKYLLASILNPSNKKRVTKGSYDLQELLLWLELKREEFKKSIN